MLLSAPSLSDEPRAFRLSPPQSHAASRRAKLSEAHVLALRMYTTAAYKSLNEPLRDRSRTAPHPFAVTVAFINEGIKRLRAVGKAADCH